MTKFLLSALAIALLPAPALAEPAQTVSSIVKTADLDLGTAEGRQSLDRRISIAAAEVCGTASDVDLAGQNDVRRCRAETVARVSNQALAQAAGQPIMVAAK